jgi:hypothetical protein
VCVHPTAFPEECPLLSHSAGARSANTRFADLTCS